VQNKLTKYKMSLFFFIALVLVIILGAYLMAKRQTKPMVDTATHSLSSTSAKQTYQPNATSVKKGGASSSLPEPTGQLLNKRVVSLSSTDPKDNGAMESTCQTVPDAQCEIELSNEGTVKNVKPNTPGSGQALIDWNVDKIGLFAGKWTVTAIAMRGNQSAVSHKETLTVEQ
jgi:septal ring-binding cell division protein DamX